MGFFINPYCLGINLKKSFCLGQKIKDFFSFLDGVCFLIKVRMLFTRPSSTTSFKTSFLASVTWVRASACTSVTSAVSYLPTRLARCSVGPGISCGARKLAQTPRVTKKKKEGDKLNFEMIWARLGLIPRVSPTNLFRLWAQANPFIKQLLAHQKLYRLDTHIPIAWNCL